jgi:hypothetical protein
LTGLDLSNNKLSGPIPDDISQKLRLVTSLDLSYNSFSGEIPLSLANCSHLNVLKLDHNQLAGAIPLQLGQLNRIKTFSVSNNLLSGPVPVFTSTSVATAESYANNLGLCGGPLRACQGAPKKSHVGVVIAAAAAGGHCSLLLLARSSFKGSLVEWITDVSSNSLLQTTIDKCLVGKGFDNELTQFLKVACNCVLPGHCKGETYYVSSVPAS